MWNREVQLIKTEAIILKENFESALRKLYNKTVFYDIIIAQSWRGDILVGIFAELLFVCFFTELPTIIYNYSHNSKIKHFFQFFTKSYDLFYSVL